MSGKKGRSGPRPSLTTQVNRALEQVDANIEAIFQSLITRALQGDKEACIYLIDRRMGRPHQSQDLRVKAERVYSPEELQLMNAPLLDQSKLIEQWGNGAGRGVTPSHSDILDSQAEREENQGKDAI